jgi:Spy/CpxP family protein refolding chaperone
MYFKLALCIFLAAAPFTAVAQMPHGRPMMGMGSAMQIDRSLTVLQKNLNLTDSQVSKIRQLVESRKTRFQALREQTRPKFEQLMSLLRQPNPDPSAVGKATIELKRAHDQARSEQAAIETDFLNILTDSQRQTVNTIRSQAPSTMVLFRLGLLAPDGMDRGLYLGE